MQFNFLAIATLNGPSYRLLHYVSIRGMALQANATVRFLRQLIYNTRFTPAVQILRRFGTEDNAESLTRAVHPVAHKEPAWTTAEKAVSVIKSGMRVYVHSGAATPLILVKAMTKHGMSSKLENVEVIHMVTGGNAEYAQPNFRGIFRASCMIVGDDSRMAVDEGRVDVIPVFLSAVPLLFKRGLLKLDVAMVTVSPPDSHGFCTLTTNVDTALSAVISAKHVIGQVNAHAPRVLGDGIIHVSQLDAVVQGDAPLPEMCVQRPSPAEDAVARLVANSLIDDGATLQLGYGRIPHIALNHVTQRDLGVHSEIISDGFVSLFKSGHVTNARKVIHQGKIVGTRAFGTKDLYSFVNNNPAVVLGDASWVAQSTTIARNPKVTGLYSCTEVDLTGQVCCDSIGVGGLVDFMLGAACSSDGLGKPIVAMTSVTPSGESKIVPQFKPDAAVVTTRAHVHYVATEFGIAYLFGKTLRQRAYELIRIAHPDYREELEKAAFESLRVMPCRQ